MYDLVNHMANAEGLDCFQVTGECPNWDNMSLTVTSWTRFISNNLTIDPTTLFLHDNELTR